MNEPEWILFVKMAGLNELKVPLLIFYDCECSSGEHLKADIIEIAARCFPEIRNASFESLISTSQDLGRFSKFAFYNTFVY